MIDFSKELCDFMNSCPTPFQFTQVASKKLIEAGYQELKETDDWGENPPKKAFVIREKRALIAFNIGSLEQGIIVGTHCDSPVLRLDPNHSKTKLNCNLADCSAYGGGIWQLWADRPLRLAGCVVLKDQTILPFDSEEPIAVIPSIAAHFPKSSIDEINNNIRSPITGLEDSTAIKEYIAKKLNINGFDIATFELSFVDANPPKIIGAKKEFLASQRIDNLSSTFSGLKALLSSEPKNTLNILAVFDYEEVGSNTSTGAKGNFLHTVLSKLIPDREKYHVFIAKSLVVSSDNAHALHPNYSSKHDPMHAPQLGSGVTMKKSPGYQYATDMASSYPLKRAAEAAGVSIAIIINRNDIMSGSTIGPHVSTQLGIATVDIGQPQLAMHSPRELVALKDIDANTRLLVELYNHYEDYRYK